MTTLLLLTSCASAPPGKVPGTGARHLSLTGEAFSVYQTLPLGKSLLTSPRFKVVDDFNSGELKNHRGAPWQIQGASPEQLSFAIDKDDARYQYRGHSLKLNFDIHPGQRAALKSSLERLDMSQAQYLAFKCRMKTPAPFKGRIRLSLGDGRAKEVIQDITSRCLEHHTKYGEVILPMSLFKGLDLDQLSRIELTVVPRETKVTGSIWIDEMAFYGDNDVEFESHRDNLVGFPRVVIHSRRASQLRLLTTVSKKGFLKEVAQDTWKYFENARDKETHLIVDHLRVGDAPLAADYTSPTNIAMDLLAIVAARELEIISKEAAFNETRAVLKTLSKMKRWKGLFYNFYNTTKLDITRNFVSSVDNGWLAISLVVVRQAFGGELAKEATTLLDDLDFGEFLDPENNQISIGYDAEKDEMASYHYGLLATEARAMSLCAIGKGDVAPAHWWFLYRTPPAVWKWQTQQPQGVEKIEEGVNYFQGHYTYQGKKFVPSWGGSLFEFLMPTLVLKERKLAPKGLGLNNRIVTEIQRDYALREKKYAVWGFSPAAVTSGRRWRYTEFGMKALGVKGYPDQAVVTPHVTFLALDVLPKEALANIRRLLDFEIYGEYGFYDSLNLRREKVNHQYLALDQGMILVAICNYLKKGIIQEYYHADSIGKRGEDLLMKESFFNT